MEDTKFLRHPSDKLDDKRGMRGNFPRFCGRFFFAVVCLHLSACGALPSSSQPIDEPSSLKMETSLKKRLQISGEVKKKAFLGGEIVVEVREGVACDQGFCPTVGRPALVSTRLAQPGNFQLSLESSSTLLIVLAHYQSPSGENWLAHETRSQEELEKSPILLSLDRPHAPLR